VDGRDKPGHVEKVRKVGKANGSRERAPDDRLRLSTVFTRRKCPPYECCVPWTLRSTVSAFTRVVDALW